MINEYALALSVRPILVIAIERLRFTFSNSREAKRCGKLGQEKKLIKHAHRAHLVTSSYARDENNILKVT